MEDDERGREESSKISIKGMGSYSCERNPLVRQEKKPFRTVGEGCKVSRAINVLEKLA